MPGNWSSRPAGSRYELKGVLRPPLMLEAALEHTLLANTLDGNDHLDGLRGFAQIHRDTEVR